MKKMMKRIRMEENWQERVKIAGDKFPETPFVKVFEKIQLAAEMETRNLGLMRQCHQLLGRWLSQIIRNGEAQVLHDLADAVADWKRHKPKPNYDLEVLFSMNGLFPPGWTKRWITGFDPKTKRPIRGLPIGAARDAIAMRDIKENLARTDPNFDESEWESRRRKIQRYAKEFKIPLDDTSGRPSKKSRHNFAGKL